MSTLPRSLRPAQADIEGPDAFGTLDKQHETTTLIELGVLVLGLTISYFGIFTGYLWEYWESPQYSHGYLIPAISIALWVIRYRPIEKDIPLWHRLIGLGLVAACLAGRVYYAYGGFGWQEAMTFIPAVTGVFIMVGGLNCLRWAWPGLIFLVFMYNVPGATMREMLYKLQHWAAVFTGMTLQTMGYDAYWDGNRIQLKDVQLGVVDACSGLRMLTVFVAFAVAGVFFTKRPWWHRLVVLLCAVPIALAANVFRITVTGILHAMHWGELANKVFHDFAGYVMMPVGLGLLYLLWVILDNIFIEEEKTQVAPLGMGRRKTSAAPSV